MGGGGVMTGVVVAIDGPSGVGKSTVAREVARRLGLSYLDTGATYRACALACLREGISLSHESDVAACAATMNVTITLDPDDPRVSIDGEDVSQLIRGAAITGAVSDVATNLEARAVLGDWQRRIIADEVSGGRSSGAGIVVEGRDITTVIAPDAEARVLMTADAEVRVARRASQDADEGRESDVEATRSAVIGRDARDAKAVNVHTAADGVVTLDTTDMTIDEAVQAVIDALHRGAM